MNKNLWNISPDELKDLVPEMGFSLVSAKIGKEGMPVGFMYREQPIDKEDSGWRFLSGTEDQDFLDDESNSKFLAVNTVANFDPAIIPYLKSKIGIEWERVAESDKFIQITDE